MAPKDPKYVRLRAGLATGGCLGDISETGSGWFIGGMDIQPFPEDDYPEAQAYVRQKLREGHLEPASVREHTTVREASKELRDLHVEQLDERELHDRAGHQEAQIVQKARATQAKLLRLRDQDDDDVVDVEALDADPAVVTPKSRQRVKEESGS